MRQIYYDLTELLYLSKGFKSYYGISKVVAEGAREVFLLDRGVRFVAFSQSHDAFFEIFPEASASSDGGVNLNVPNAGEPTFIRRVFRKPHMVRDIIAPVVFGLLDLRERRRWTRSGVPLTPLDLSGGTFISCARPKLMIHALERLTRFENIKIHALLHDVIPLHGDGPELLERFPSSFQADTDYVIHHADQIIANSCFSRDDIHFAAGEGALSHPKEMTFAALAHEFRAGREAPSSDLPDKPYFLMVGTSLGRKNLDVVLRAMALIAADGEQPPLLVLAGRQRRRTAAFLDTPQMAAVKPHVHLIDSPHQTDLGRLYENALGTILPSRIEGWGLPAAEALWLGVPALCSDIPVLREVCTEMGLYFDVDDAEKLAEYMKTLATNAEFRAERADIISRNRSHLRTWQNFGRDLLDRVESFPEA